VTSVDTFDRMKPGKGLPILFWRSSIAAAMAGLLVPVSAAAVAGRPSNGALSQRLAELARPSVSSAPPARQARILRLAAHGPGSLVREGDRVLVEVRFDSGAVAALGDLRAAGASIVDVSRRYQTITVAAKPAELRNLSVVPRVAGVAEVLAPITAAGPPCPSGSLVSEGDGQLGAALGRKEFGVDGADVTVGILSDSFGRDAGAKTSASQDATSGDLPGSGNPCGNADPVNVLDDTGTAGADEGRAMAQIVHDLAPGARLAFATAFTSETDFAANIKKLAEPVSSGGAGADVIADDIFFFGEPFFQDGPVAVAANEVSAAGTAYFSAAGNDNVVDAQKRDIGSWEAPEFRDLPSCPATLGAATHHCMDFNPASGSDNTFGVTVANEATLRVDMQWAEPWNGVESDLDLFLLDSSGELLEWSTEDNVGNSQKPVEVVRWTNTTGSSQNVDLAINRCFGESCNPAASGTTKPRLKLVILDNGAKGVTATEYPESGEGDTVGPTIFGHSGAEGAISVGAVPFFNSELPEYYSSHGPVTHYFGPVSGAAAAPPLAEPDLLGKPEIAATDGGVNTFFGSPGGGGFRFYGTSAAAPHAAAVAALMLDANPLLDPVEVRAALLDSGRSVGSHWHDSVVGGGLVDAVGALDRVAEPTSSEGGEEEGGSAGEEEGSGTTGEGGPTAESGQATAAPVYSQISSQATSPHVPRTFLRWHPRRVIRTPHRRARAVFWFGSNEAGATFVCRVDRTLFRRCKRRYARRFRVGRHVLRVAARDAAGNPDRTPAVYHFRVKRRRAR